MVTSFLSTGAAALAAMLVANVLGAKGAGVFALARVVPTVVAAVLGAGVTMSNAYLVGGRRYSIQAITEASMSLALIIGFIGWGGWIACGSIVHARFFSSLSETAVLLVGISIPVQMVRNSAVATKVAEAFRPLSAAFTFVLRPMIASLSVSEARAQGVSLYRRVFALNLLLVVIMAFAGGPIIIRMFGPDFVAAVPAFQILLVGLAALGGAGVLNGYNVGIGRPEFNSYTALAGLVITVIGDVTLIPHYSLIGAAVTSSVAYSVKAAALTLLFLSTSGISLPQLMGMKEYSPDLA